MTRSMVLTRTAAVSSIGVDLARPNSWPSTGQKFGPLMMGEKPTLLQQQQPTEHRLQLPALGRLPYECSCNLTLSFVIPCSDILYSLPTAARTRHLGRVVIVVVVVVVAAAVRIHRALHSKAATAATTTHKACSYT